MSFRFSPVKYQPGSKLPAQFTKLAQNYFAPNQRYASAIRAIFLLASADINKDRSGEVVTEGFLDRRIPCFVPGEDHAGSLA